MPDDACEETTYGETEDYMADIQVVYGINDQSLEANDIVISTLANNQYVIEFDATSTTDALMLYVINSAGQTVAYNRVYANGTKYRYELDMSYAAKGNYLIKLGNDNFFKTQKIIVR